MAISDKIESIENHLKKDYQSIANLGADLTNVDKNIENISSLLDGVYDVLPKTEFQEGTSVTIEGGLKGKIDFDEDNGKKVVGIGQTTQAILPSGYQQVEYIESSGSQYINTQYYANQKTKIIADYYIQPNAEGFLFGARVDGSDTNQFGVYFKENENRYAYRFDNLSVINIYGTVGVKTHAEFSTNKYLINNGTIIQDDIQYTGTFLGTLPLYVLAQNQGGTATLVSNIKLYSFKILEDDELVRNMIPCYRISDNAIGMYDTVNNVFYTNAGTGVFGKGTNAPTPSTPVPIQCVTGNQDVVVSGINLLDDSNHKNKDVPSSAGFYINNAPFNLSGGTYRFGVFVDNQLITTPALMALSFKSGGTTVLEKNAPNQDITITDEQASIIDRVSLYFNGTFVSTYSGKKITGVMITTSEITTYEPYVTPRTYQFSLGNNKFYKIGDYADELLYDVDEDKVYKLEKIHRYDFTGGEDFTRIVVTGKPLPYFRLYLTSQALGITSTSSTIKSNRYKGGTDAELVNNDYPTISMSGNANNQLNITQNLSTADEFKTYLTNNPTYVCYPRVTAELIELTDTTLKQQVKNWYYSQSFSGTTIIESNGDLPMILKVRALKGES